MAMKISHVRENVFTEAEAISMGLPIGGDHHYHGLGEEFFLEIIDKLDEVAEGYRGTKNAKIPSRRENYFLLISKYNDKDGNVVNVPVYINETARCNNVFIDVNKIATSFGKDDFWKYVQRQVRDGNLVKIKRSTKPSETYTPSLYDYRNNASNNSIPQKSDLSTGSSKKLLKRMTRKHPTLPTRRRPLHAKFSPT